jgi:hypothetical protein
MCHIYGHGRSRATRLTGHAGFDRLFGLARRSGEDSPLSHAPDIAAGRLPAEAIERNFADLHPRLSPREARVAAERCLFCHDAPCVQACPTATLIDCSGWRAAAVRTAP